MAKGVDISNHLPFIIEALNNGESLRMISAKIGIERMTLTRKLKQLGIKTPTKEESAKMTWKNHQHPRLGQKCELCPVYGKKMSTVTREKMKAVWAMAAERRKYRKKHTHGYILVYAPDNPAADRTGYVLEHRLIMEKHIGRHLTSNEIVHHINENKTDNRIENLEITTRGTHAKIHNNLGGINEHNRINRQTLQRA